MPITIDEVTTQVVPTERGSDGNSGPPAANPPPSPEAERRKWREQAERQSVRAARVTAD